MDLKGHFQYWREKLRIEVGMSREEALDRFVEWRSTKKTCQRCEGEKYVDCCPVHLICEETDYVGDAARNDHGSGVVEAPQSQTLRTGLSEKRKRTSLRSPIGSEEGLPGGRLDDVVQDPPSNFRTVRTTDTRHRRTTPGLTPSSQINADQRSFDDSKQGIQSTCLSCFGTFCALIGQKISWCHRFEDLK